MPAPLLFAAESRTLLMFVPAGLAWVLCYFIVMRAIRFYWKRFTTTSETRCARDAPRTLVGRLVRNELGRRYTWRVRPLSR